MLLPDEPVLHVGDRLRITCPEAPDLCVERRVGFDGTIDLPLLGPIAVALRHPSDVQRLVIDLAADRLAPLRATVQLLGASKDEISISGAVAHPLRLYAPRGIDPERLLLAAGVLPEADRSLLSQKGRVRPGTVLDVPILAVDRRVSVVGAVVNPTSLPPSDGLLLGRAIEAAGGLAAHANDQEIVVVRAQEPIPLRLPADSNFRLLPGDLVRVGLIADRHYVVVKGLVGQPGSVDYAPGMTISRALAAAGGVLPTAKAGTVVWQTGSKTYRLSIAFLFDHRIPDPVLGREDTLVVEADKP